MTHFLDAPTALPTTITNATDEADLHPLVHNEANDLLNQMQAEMGAWETFVVTSARFGAVADYTTVTDAQTTVDSALLYSPGGQFTAAMNGKTAGVHGAATGGRRHYAVLAYVSATFMTMSVAATLAVTGATVDIGTDNLVPIKAAVAAAAAAGGGTVYIPPGTYLLNAPNTTNAAGTGVMIDIPSKVHIRGAGRGATTLKTAATWNVCHSGNILHALNQNTFGIADLTVDATGLIAADGLKFESCSRATFRDITVTGGYIGFQAIGCTDMQYVNCFATSQADGDDPANGIGFNVSELVAKSQTGTQRIHLVNCIARVAAAIGFNIESDNASSYVQRVKLTNCHADAGLATGFKVLTARNVILASCTAATNAGIGFDIQLSQKIVLNGCTAESNGLSGIRLYGSSHCTIGGSMAAENSTAAPGVNAGLYLVDNGATGSTHNVVSGCTLSCPNGSGNQSYGFFNDGTNSGNTTIVGCRFFQNFQPRQVWLAATDQMLFCYGVNAANLPSNGTLVWVEAGVLRTRLDDAAAAVGGTHALDAPTRAASDTGAVSLDVRTGRVFRRTLTGGVTYTLTNPQDGQEIELHLIQDNSGNHTVAFASTVKFAGGVASFSTTANVRDVYRLRYDGTSAAWIETSRSLGTA